MMKPTVGQILENVDFAVNQSLGPNKLTASEKTALLTSIADRLISDEFWERDRRLQNERADKERKTREFIEDLIKKS